MATDSQNYSNHTRLVPAFHFFIFPLAIVFFGWSIARLIRAPGAETAYMLIGALALVGGTLYGRVFALQAQNRVIRLEERMRLARLLPADMQQHVDTISPSQLIGLRFAPDGELVELARKTVANPAMTAKEIKVAVKNWRPDPYRV